MLPPFVPELNEIKFIEIPTCSTLLKLEDGKIVPMMDKMVEFANAFLENYTQTAEQMNRIREKLETKRIELDAAQLKLKDQREKEVLQRMLKRKSPGGGGRGDDGDGDRVDKDYYSDDENSEIVRMVPSRAVVRSAMTECRNPTGCPEEELSETDYSPLDRNGKPWRSGFGPIGWRGTMCLPVNTCLRRNLYGDMHSVSFLVKKKQNVTAGKKNSTIYLPRSFTKTYFLGLKKEYFSWMWEDEAVCANPRERYALILYFCRTKGCRAYRGMSSCLNAEMTGLSFNGRGHSYIEANSRSKALSDRYVARREPVGDGKKKKVPRAHLSQYLRRSDNKVVFVDPSIGSPNYTEEDIQAMIVKYGLQKQFAITRDQLYEVVFPWRGDWNYKRDFVMVTSYYFMKDPKYRTEINLACANMHALWIKRISERDVDEKSREIAEMSQRKMDSFKGLYLCDPETRKPLEQIPFSHSHFDSNGVPGFRTWYDYDPWILLDSTRDVCAQKRRKMKMSAAETKKAKAALRLASLKIKTAHVAHTASEVADPVAMDSVAIPSMVTLEDLMPAIPMAQMVE